MKIGIPRAWLVAIPEEWLGLPVDEIRRRIEMWRRLEEYPCDEGQEYYVGKKKKRTLSVEEREHERSGILFRESRTGPLKDIADPNPVLEAETISLKHRRNARIEAIYAIASRRQKKILDCIGQGMEPPEIAEQLGISNEAVRSQMSHLRAKIRAKT